MITIKPHHFIDIIKLYGGGIEVFVPDEKMGHDFYKVANEIINNPDIGLRLTIHADDICQPCHCCQNGICDDGLSVIKGISKKDKYNKMLDQRIIDLLSLNIKHTYTALELCQLIHKDSQIIFDVWKEEEDDLTQRRYELFCLGIKKYISKN
ncbi:MAG: DUF1284 domain-containing protein [Coprobacillus sp.]